MHHDCKSLDPCEHAVAKLIIQIPCLNEATTLPATLRDLPRSVPGIDVVEVLVIDDGSKDDTSAVAHACGVDHVVRFRSHKGLAAAFMAGLDAAVSRGADYIVNTDADNQYAGSDIPKLVAPLIRSEADIVIGDRNISTLATHAPPQAMAAARRELGRPAAVEHPGTRHDLWVPCVHP